VTNFMVSSQIALQQQQGRGGVCNSRRQRAVGTCRDTCQSEHAGRIERKRDRLRPTLLPLIHHPMHSYPTQN
jgi:hypothetical protein